MLPKFGSLSRLLATMAAIGISAAAHAQTTYSLAVTQAAGDVHQATSTEEITVKLEGRLTGLSPLSYADTSRTAATFLEETLAFDADGQNRRARRTYRAYRKRETEDGKQTSSASLQGKKLLLTDKQGDVIVQCENGKISPEDQTDVKESFGEEIYGDGTGDPVAIGEAWKIKDTLRAGGKKIDRDSITFKLLEVTQFAGHPCAHVGITASSHLKADKNLPMVMKLKGDLYLLTDLKRVVAITLSGPITIEGYMDVEGKKMRVTGTGSYLSQSVYDWKSVGGKSVSVSGAALVK